MNSIFFVLLTKFVFAQLKFELEQQINNPQKIIAEREPNNYQLEKKEFRAYNEQGTKEQVHEQLKDEQQRQLQENSLHQRPIQEYTFCEGNNACFSGTCLESVCLCWSGAEGDNCEKNCYYCSGHGLCSSNQGCLCNLGWHGETCSQSVVSQTNSSDASTSSSAMAALYVVLPIIAIGTSIAYFCYRRIGNQYKGNPPTNTGPQSPVTDHQIPSNVSIMQQGQIIPSQEVQSNPINTSIQINLPTSNDYFQLQMRSNQEIINEKQEKNLCSICLEDISNFLEKKIKCPYKHSFHRICIDQWLRLHRTCPTCRGKIG